MNADFSLHIALVLTVMLSAVLGGNNFSTCLGASLGAGITKLTNAIAIALAGILLGTILEGFKLSNVLSQRLLPGLSSSGLFAILVSSLMVMALVTALRVPISLSQVMVGGVWGVGLATGVPVDGTYSVEVLASWMASPVVAYVASAIVERAVLQLGQNARDVITLNRLYASLTLIAGFYAAYTLGANTVGLLVGLFPKSVGDPLLLSLILSLSAAAGVAFLSRGTVRSVADNLVGLNPSTALSAQFGGALSVHLFTQLGLPVSVSQVVIGGMSGAASVKRMVITNKRIVQHILAGWTVGPIAGTVVSFLVLKAF